MKLSKLIEIAQKVYKEHGDIEVTMRNDEGWGDDVRDAYFIEGNWDYGKVFQIDNEL